MKFISAKCAKVWNQPYWDIPQEVSDSKTLNSYSRKKLMKAGYMMLVDWYSDMITMYPWTACLFNFKLDCCTTINNCTAKHLLCVWNLIARYNITMVTKQSCLSLIMSVSNICKVTLIMPFKTEFLLIIYCTVARCLQIRFSVFVSIFLWEMLYW